ncbi:hypothetical protein ACLK19_28645 [Escherichia coli]
MWANGGRRVAPGCGESDLPEDPRFPKTWMATGIELAADGPRRAFLHEMNRDVFTPRGLMTVGEMSSTSLSIAGDTPALTGSELSMTFNFHKPEGGLSQW